MNLISSLFVCCRWFLSFSIFLSFFFMWVYLLPPFLGMCIEIVILWTAFASSSFFVSLLLLLFPAGIHSFVWLRHLGWWRGIHCSWSASQWSPQGKTVTKFARRHVLVKWRRISIANLREKERTQRVLLYASAEGTDLPQDFALLLSSRFLL